MHLLALSRPAAALFGWIEAAAGWLDERRMTAHLLIYLFIAAMYTLAAVAALRDLVSLASVAW